MAISYPIATDAEAALSTPLGFAEREREAAAIAGADVVFTSEAVGPSFTTREALQEACASQIAKPYVLVRPLLKGRRGEPPLRPVNAEGRRWPVARATEPPLWRLSISYWRKPAAEAAPSEPARELRRRPEADRLSSRELRALVAQPLGPAKPQQPLDIGLFEVRPPEAPHIVMPDE